MRGPLRTVIAVAIVAVTVVLVWRVVLGGPDPEVGDCVDAGNELVGCADRAAVFKLVREVDTWWRLPARQPQALPVSQSLYCGVALEGAPAPSSEYVSCLLLAGAELARDARALRFAGAGSASAVAEHGGRVKVRGEGWRIFYVLHRGQLDPGLPAILAKPSAVLFVAYIDDAMKRRAEVAAATRCAREPVPAA